MYCVILASGHEKIDAFLGLLAGKTQRVGTSMKSGAAKLT
jgi:hypothetical protein